MTINEIITLIASVISLLGAATGIFIARSTRRKNEGDAALAISQAAENIVTIREKDIKLKQSQIDALCSKMGQLEQYMEYLHDWIEQHIDHGLPKPVTFREFLRQKDIDPIENNPCD